MKFIVSRECLIKPLQHVISPLRGRNTLHIIGNMLLQVRKDSLLLTSTDLEIDMVARVALNADHDASATTVPARKFWEICRGLPEGTEITVRQENDRMHIMSGHSRFSISTLPAAYFPNIEDWESKVEFHLPQATMKRLIEYTQFSMSHQDVRYSLNGMLFSSDGDSVRTVSTNGHSLAVCSMQVGDDLPSNSVIVPRKGVMELLRLLDGSENTVKLQIGSNHIRASVGEYIFTSKLIDGSFPDYSHVFPKNPDKTLKAGCDVLKQALTRVAIISPSPFSGVRLSMSANKLKITAKNSENDEAEEILDVAYNSAEIEICLNVSYVLDVLNALKCDDVRLLLTDCFSSVQIEDCANKAAAYILMPMRM